MEFSFIFLFLVFFYFYFFLAKISDDICIKVRYKCMVGYRGLSSGAWNGDTEEAIWLKGGRGGALSKWAKERPKVASIQWVEAKFFWLKEWKRKLWVMVQSRVLYISHEDTDKPLCANSFLLFFLPFFPFFSFLPNVLWWTKRPSLFSQCFSQLNNSIFESY